jgi:hypothetical protein
MAKKFEFAYEISRPQTMVNGSRDLINFGSGPDINALRHVALTMMPDLPDREGLTITYLVLFTVRKEKSPDSFPLLRALVQIGCEGNATDDEKDAVNGIYGVTIWSGPDQSRVLIVKADFETVSDEKIGPLPTVGEIYAALIPSGDL